MLEIFPLLLEENSPTFGSQPKCVEESWYSKKTKPVGGNLPKPSFRNASLAGKTTPQAHGLSPYKITKPQQNANKFSLLWFHYFAHLNAFASTPSWNRTSNSPLGGVCYIHLTMGANALSRKRQPSPQEGLVISI